MKFLNIDKLIKDLEDCQRDYAMASQYNFTTAEGAVISQVLDIIVEALKDATIQANIEESK